MYTCPGCHSALKRIDTPEKFFWRCEGCGGRAFKPSQLKRKVRPEFVALLWEKARTATRRERPCPVCAQPMTVVREEPGFIQPLEVDVCLPCQLIWLDPKEFQVLPELPAQQPLAEEAKQSLAWAEANLLAVKAVWDREREAQRRRHNPMFEDLLDLLF